VSKSPDFLTRVKGRLEERRKELVELLQNNAITPNSGGGGKDMGDEAQSASMDKLQNSLEQAEIDEMRSINDALDRIEKDAYGFCVECDDTISDKRLEYSPFAARCIVCQEEAEQR
jgi:DnaK suppressor protein